MPAVGKSMETKYLGHVAFLNHCRRWMPKQYQHLVAPVAAISTVWETQLQITKTDRHGDNKAWPS